MNLTSQSKDVYRWTGQCMWHSFLVVFAEQHRRMWPCVALDPDAALEELTN